MCCPPCELGFRAVWGSKVCVSECVCMKTAFHLAFVLFAKCSITKVVRASSLCVFWGGQLLLLITCCGTWSTSTARLMKLPLVYRLYQTSIDVRVCIFSTRIKRLSVPSRPHKMRSTICATAYSILHLHIHKIVFDFSVIIFYPFLLFPSVLKSALSRNRTNLKVYIYHFCIVSMYMYPSVDIKGFGSVLASII